MSPSRVLESQLDKHQFARPLGQILRPEDLGHFRNNSKRQHQAQNPHIARLGCGQTYFMSSNAAKWIGLLRENACTFMDSSSGLNCIAEGELLVLVNATLKSITLLR